MTQGVAPNNRKRILVIGGAGYVGSRLVLALAALGHHVEILDLFWFGESNFLWPIGQKRKGDARDLVEADLRSFDTVIWLAGFSNDPMANFSPQANFVENAALPAYLAYTAKRAGVKRFINASSCSAYGYDPDQLLTEADVARATYPYGVAKLMAETGCHQQADGKFSVISLRKGTISGYSRRMRFDLIINTMFKDALTRKAIHVRGGEIWRPILAMDDAVRAYIAAIDAPSYISGIFNVMSENATVRETAEVVASVVRKRLRKSVFIVDQKPDEEKRSYRANDTQIRHKLAFVPQGSIASIAEDLCAHVSEWKNFDDPIYYNIEIFRALPKSGQSLSGSLAQL